MRRPSRVRAQRLLRLLGREALAEREALQGDEGRGAAEEEHAPRLVHRVAAVDEHRRIHPSRRKQHVFLFSEQGAQALKSAGRGPT